MKAQPIPEPLLKLRRQLDACRAAGKRAVFPDDLKRQAAVLVNDYSSTTVGRALNVSASCLSRWRRQALALDIDSNGPDRHLPPQHAGTFVALPAVEDVAERYPLAVTLACSGDDQQICLQGDVTLDQWRQILNMVAQALVP